MSDPRLERPDWRGRTNLDAFTIAVVEHAEQIGGHEFIVTQGSYQGTGGDPDSASTHSLGGAVDLAWCGHDRCLLALREAGGFFWHRTPDQGDWGHHIHGGPLGHPLQAPVLANQETAYLAGFNGLGHLGHGGPDDGPRLDPIPAPIWPWPEEDDMPKWSEWPQEEKDAFLKDIAKAVWTASVNQSGTFAKSMVEAAGRLAKRTLGES